MTPTIDEQFSTRDAVKFFAGLGLDFDHSNLKDWHRRGILPGKPVGHGNERRYTLRDIAFIACLSFVGGQARYGGLDEARPLADGLAQYILSIYETGPDGAAIDAASVYALTYDYCGHLSLDEVNGDRKYRGAAGNYGFRGAVMVHPGLMALNLLREAEKIMQQRTEKR